MKQEIEAKLERLESRVTFLRDHADTTVEELEQDDLLRSAIERNFQVALEVVIDICSMILAYEDLEKPESYRKMIVELGDAGILSADFAEQFADAAGFRNVLVHQYADVNIRMMHSFLTDRLADFDTFTRHIATYANNLDG